ncbi:hypothetical protein TNIN_173161, partial [Trichonephila inaurata madagascariensis]
MRLMLSWFKVMMVKGWMGHLISELVFIPYLRAMI